jgi:hypothetical protein
MVLVAQLRHFSRPQAVVRNLLTSEGSVFYACGGRIPLSGTGADGLRPQLSRAPVSTKNEDQYHEDMI